MHSIDKAIYNFLASVATGLPFMVVIYILSCFFKTKGATREIVSTVSSVFNYPA